ncbi:MAG: hypothetical protein ABIE94_00485 [archaeon]
MIPHFRKDFFLIASKYAKSKRSRNVERVLKKQPIVKKRLPDGRSRPKIYEMPKPKPYVKPVAPRPEPVLEIKRKPKRTVSARKVKIKEIELQLKELEVFYKQLKRKGYPMESLKKLDRKMKEIKKSIKKKKQKT